MSKKKTQEELIDELADLQSELTNNDSHESRIEILLIAILRELKGNKAK